MLQVSRMLAPVTSLGPGRRVGLWVQGCTLACEGCASADTWNPQGGRGIRLPDLVERLASAYRSDSSLFGLTLTGGEPVQQAGAVAEVVRGLREQVDREVDVLLFTGYPLGVARRLGRDLLTEVDALVAGRYDARAGYGGPLVGSANQRLVLQTDLARRRWGGAEPGPHLQVMLDRTDLVLAGIPRPGDLERFREVLAGRGVEMERASWQA
ncbi:4Fe-4S single cluster domain-containing protein [Ornithinimicrobium avium]|nr:4Fe-4S single cluster domain-containing protein [Ornithinimicrobium avium]